MTKSFWIRRAVMALCIIAAAATSWMFSRQNNFSVSELPSYNQIGDFTLVNQNGKAVSAQTLLGKTWIADFIFTRCGGPCPRMTNQFKKIQDSLQNKSVNLVSFSVDPAYDTPEQLKAYGDKFGADYSNWDFLTGDQEQIHRLSIQHFLLGVSEIPEKERERLDQGFNHSSKFALVDKRGLIRGYFDSEDSESMRLLLKQAEALAKA